jgi:hypothetical protein
VIINRTKWAKRVIKILIELPFESFNRPGRIDIQVRMREENWDKIESQYTLKNYHAVILLEYQTRITLLQNHCIPVYEQVITVGDINIIFQAGAVRAAEAIGIRRPAGGDDVVAVEQPVHVLVPVRLRIGMVKQDTAHRPTPQVGLGSIPLQAR